MAVLHKQRARKPQAIGPISVGYGNFAQVGLLKNQHISVQILGTPHVYSLNLELDEAERAANKMLEYITKHRQGTL